MEKGHRTVIDVVERGRPVDSAVQADHIFQARFPSPVVGWLRTQWYRRRVSMNSVVAEAVCAVRTGQVVLDALTSASAGDDEGAQRFTVRLPGPDYDWLRLEAFVRHISINRLLTAVLAVQMPPGDSDGDVRVRH